MILNEFYDALPSLDAVIFALCFAIVVFSVLNYKYKKAKKRFDDEFKKN